MAELNIVLIEPSRAVLLVLQINLFHSHQNIFNFLHFLNEYQFIRYSLGFSDKDLQKNYVFGIHRDTSE